jgi:4a-hydroxytetrahydrobiopterin dehydratase
MSAPACEDLTKKKCLPCEGGIPALDRGEAERLLASTPGWSIDADSKRISRSWTVKDFMAGIDFFKEVANVAETEGHHPDLHLEGYKNVKIVLWTHAVGGLTENDFIVAAKINELPVRAKK